MESDLKGKLLIRLQGVSSAVTGEADPSAVEARRRPLPPPPSRGALSEAVDLSTVLKDTYILCLASHVSAMLSYILILAPSPCRCSFWLKASRPDPIHPALLPPPQPGSYFI